MAKYPELEAASVEELQETFNQLDLSVKVTEPRVIGMRAALAESEAILADMKYRRGKAAYWLTIKKGKR